MVSPTGEASLVASSSKSQLGGEKVSSGIDKKVINHVLTQWFKSPDSNKQIHSTRNSYLATHILNYIHQFFLQCG